MGLHDKKRTVRPYSRNLIRAYGSLLKIAMPEKDSVLDLVARG
jgi:hypothetical protein